MKHSNDKQADRKPAKPIGDHTVEMTTRELYQQMLQDKQSRPRQRTPQPEGDLSATSDLGALFRAAREDRDRAPESRDKNGFPVLDATLP